METAAPKRTLAFPRRRERQLAHSFAWVTTCLPGGIVIAAIGKRVAPDTPGITPKPLTDHACAPPDIPV